MMSAIEEGNEEEEDDDEEDKIDEQKSSNFTKLEDIKEGVKANEEDNDNHEEEDDEEDDDDEGDHYNEEEEEKQNLQLTMDSDQSVSNTLLDALAEEKELLRGLTTEHDYLLNQLKKKENEGKTQQILYLNSLKLACMQYYEQKKRKEMLLKLSTVSMKKIKTESQTRKYKSNREVNDNSSEQFPYFDVASVASNDNDKDNDILYTSEYKLAVKENSYLKKVLQDTKIIEERMKSYKDIINGSLEQVKSYQNMLKKTFD